MGLTIRKAAAADASAWLDLLRVVSGDDYPDKRVYDPAWAAAQLEEDHSETWVADFDGVILASISFLPAGSESGNPVAHIGRHLNRPEAYENGAAIALLERAFQLAHERKHLLISRVLASDNLQQQLYEQAGFTPVGFQPFKHSHKARESVVFYYRLGGHDVAARLPISESLPQIAELAQLVLGNLNIGLPAVGRDGLTGYPLQSELEFIEATREDFEIWRQHAESTTAGPVEISGAYNHGLGFLRAASTEPPAAVLAMQKGTVTAGVLCLADPVDRCIRVLESFALDQFSLGPLLGEITKRTLQEAGAYVELDILASSPRLLKTAEQIGFVPVAYFPAIYSKAGTYADVIKMVKLNAAYSLENTSLTPSAKRVADLIGQNFEDQKVGLAIINLLRGLPFFHGLGDGELRKIARLFTQKMFRAGETICKKGEYSYDAYVVMRGQIDIVLNEGAPPLAQLGNGEIFGELAFLDGTPRTASAIATQTTIALVIQRTAFNDLARREPHLGMVVLRNIALELSKRLRKSNEALPGSR
jgi:CRP/FNR family transcriptional regulator, cyclic AMP receptor protein